MPLLKALAEVLDCAPQGLLEDHLAAGGSERALFDRLCEAERATYDQCCRAWAESLGIRYHPLPARSLDLALMQRIPLDVARRYGAIVAEEEDGELAVVLRDPFDILAVDAIQEITKCAVETLLSTPIAIDRALQRYERGDTGIEGLIARLRTAELSEQVLADPDKLREVAGDDAVVQILDYIIGEAMRIDASDIHLEPLKNAFRIRVRIDGSLEELQSLPSSLHRPVCSRVKVLASMDIGENRRPQDGRILFEADGRSVELRVSALPSVHGEKVVLRILDQSKMNLDLDTLDLSPNVLTAFRAGFSAPNGLVLLTGPTGSGKTTTLYAALSELNKVDANLVTVEDPVEYDLPGTTQVQVDVKAERTFAKALRSILRQDPDVCMIGEIRDAETAGIALQAALTGHMVLSSLHTNDAPSAVIRLIDMGVEPYLLGPALRCVVAQRLLPRLCPDCSVPDHPHPDLLAAAKLSQDDPDDARTIAGLRRGAGCATCRRRGKRGRVAIHEVLTVDRNIGRAIAQRIEESDLVDAAREGGYRTLLADGLVKAAAGLVELADVLTIARDR